VDDARGPTERDVLARLRVHEDEVDVIGEHVVEPNRRHLALLAIGRGDADPVVPGVRLV
jgi:hypothetical protein